MTRKSPLTPPRPNIPDLHHTILGAGDSAQGIGREGPDALDVAEERAQALARRRVPEPDRRVQRAGQHVARREGTGGAGEAGTVGFVRGEVGSC